MTDLLAESRLSLTQLARQENKAIPTCWRWALRGVKGVVLETFSIGGRRYTTAEAFGRFVAATTAASKPEAVPTSTTRTSRQREAAIVRAEAELDDAGV